MAKGGRTVRASEIGIFVFCQRAWWYQRQNKPVINRLELAAGSQFHHRHAGRIQAARLLSILARLMILAAGLMLLVMLFLFLRGGA